MVKSSQPSPLSRISLNDQSFITSVYCAEILFICLLTTANLTKDLVPHLTVFVFALSPAVSAAKLSVQSIFIMLGRCCFQVLQGVGTFAFVPCSNQRQDRADYGNLLYKMVAIGWLWISCYTFILHGISEFKKIVSVFSPSISK